MAATGSAELAIDVKEAKSQEHSSGDPGEPVTDPVMQRNSKPGDEQTKKSRKKHVTGAGQCRHADGLVPVPALGPGRDHEWKPMRRNGRVEEGDTEAS